MPLWSFDWAELIFSALTCTGLCFGFVLQTVLITQDVFITAKQRLHTVMALSAPYTTP